jgi:integrase
MNTSKDTNSEPTQPSVKPSQATFCKVAENLYRNVSSGTYYGLTKRNGKQFRTSLKLNGKPIKDRKLAERELAKWLASVGNLTTAVDPGMTFGKIAARYAETRKANLKERSLTRLESCIQNLTPFFGETPINKINGTHCEEWLINRGPKIAAQTFAHELSAMRAVLGYALDKGMRLDNPAMKIKRRKIKNTKLHTPTLAQFAAIVAQIRKGSASSKPTDKGHSAELAANQRKAKAGADLIEFLAYSGCRIGEATAARWRDVDFDANKILIRGEAGEDERERGTKNGRNRLIDMTGNLRALLLRFKAERKPEASDFINTIKSAKTALQTACRRVNDEAQKNRRPDLQISKHFTHHDFRHFFATTCIEAGVPIPTIAAWLGHQDGGVLAMKTYGHLRQEHSAAMAARVSFTAPAMAAAA